MSDKKEIDIPTILLNQENIDSFGDDSTQYVSVATKMIATVQGRFQNAGSDKYLSYIFLLIKNQKNNSKINLQILTYIFQASCTSLQLKSKIIDNLMIITQQQSDRDYINELLEAQIQFSINLLEQQAFQVNQDNITNLIQFLISKNYEEDFKQLYQLLLQIVVTEAKILVDNNEQMKFTPKYSLAILIKLQELIDNINTVKFFNAGDSLLQYLIQNTYYTQNISVIFIRELLKIYLTDKNQIYIIKCISELKQVEDFSIQFALIQAIFAGENQNIELIKIFFSCVINCIQLISLQQKVNKFILHEKNVDQLDILFGEFQFPISLQQLLYKCIKYMQIIKDKKIVNQQSYLLRQVINQYIMAQKTENDIEEYKNICLELLQQLINAYPHLVVSMSNIFTVVEQEIDFVQASMFQMIIQQYQISNYENIQIGKTLQTICYHISIEQFLKLLQVNLSQTADIAKNLSLYYNCVKYCNKTQVQFFYQYIYRKVISWYIQSSNQADQQTQQQVEIAVNQMFSLLLTCNDINEYVTKQQQISVAMEQFCNKFLEQQSDKAKILLQYFIKITDLKLEQQDEKDEKTQQINEKYNQILSTVFIPIIVQQISNIPSDCPYYSLYIQLFYKLSQKINQQNFKYYQRILIQQLKQLSIAQTFAQQNQILNLITILYCKDLGSQQINDIIFELLKQYVQHIETQQNACKLLGKFQTIDQQRAEQILQSYTFDSKNMVFYLENINFEDQTECQKYLQYAYQNINNISSKVRYICYQICKHYVKNLLQQVQFQLTEEQVQQILVQAQQISQHAALVVCQQLVFQIGLYYLNLLTPEYVQNEIIMKKKPYPQLQQTFIQFIIQSAQQQWNQQVYNAMILIIQNADSNQVRQIVNSLQEQFYQELVACRHQSLLKQVLVSLSTKYGRQNTIEFMNYLLEKYVSNLQQQVDKDTPFSIAQKAISNQSHLQRQLISKVIRTTSVMKEGTGFGSYTAVSYIIAQEQVPNELKSQLSGGNNEDEDKEFKKLLSQQEQQINEIEQIDAKQPKEDNEEDKFAQQQRINQQDMIERRRQEQYMKLAIELNKIKQRKINRFTSQFQNTGVQYKNKRAGGDKQNVQATAVMPMLSSGKISKLDKISRNKLQEVKRIKKNINDFSLQIFLSQESLDQIQGTDQEVIKQLKQIIQEQQRRIVFLQDRNYLQDSINSQNSEDQKEDQIKQLIEQYSQLKTEIQNVKQCYCQLYDQNQELQKSIDAKKQEQQELVNKNVKLMAELQVANQQITQYKNQDQSYFLDEKLRVQQKLYENQNKQIYNEQEQLNTDKQQLEQLQEQNKQLQEQNKQLNNQIKTLFDDTSLKSISQLEQELSLTKQQVEKYQAELLTKQTQYQENDSKCKALIVSLQQQLTTMEMKVKNMQQSQTIVLSEQSTQQQIQIEQLKAQLKEYEEDCKDIIAVADNNKKLKVLVEKQKTLIETLKTEKINQQKVDLNQNQQLSRQIQIQNLQLQQVERKYNLLYTDYITLKQKYDLMVSDDIYLKINDICAKDEQKLNNIQQLSDQLIEENEQKQNKLINTLKQQQEQHDKTMQILQKNFQQFQKQIDSNEINEEEKQQEEDELYNKMLEGKISESESSDMNIQQIKEEIDSQEQKEISEEFNRQKQEIQEEQNQEEIQLEFQFETEQPLVLTFNGKELTQITKKENKFILDEDYIGLELQLNQVSFVVQLGQQEIDVEDNKIILNITKL